MKRERGICSQCGRDMAVRVPAGGDGSEARPYPHRDHMGFVCHGDRYAALSARAALGKEGA